MNGSAGLKRLGLYVLSVCLIAIVAFSLAYAYTGRKDFCALCHEIRPAVEANEKSVHANVACYDCHAGPGLVRKVGARFALLRDFYRHFSGQYSEPLNADGDLYKKITDDRCEHCHTTNRVFTPEKGVLIDHSIHKENGIPCTRCHNRVAHTVETTSTYFDRIQMEGCMQCHVGGEGKPPKRCDACHPEKFQLPYNCSSCHVGDDIAAITPKEHFEKDFAGAGHGKIARESFAYCYQCHVRDYCVRCHEQGEVKADLPPQTETEFHKPRSHFSRTFLPPEHGDEAKERGKDYCYQCHEPEFCTDCHGDIEMPHPPTWEKEHGKIVASEGFIGKCANCHPSRNQFCESGCHHKGWNPDKGPLIETHEEVVEKQGVEYCLDCHTNIFCAVCHVTGEQKEKFRENDD